MVYDDMLKGLKQAVKHGIKIGIGTDAAMRYVTHYDIWREMKHYMKFAGLTTAEVIHLVTKANAEILGVDKRTGTIDIGKSADLIILDQNPLEEIKALANVGTVIIRGNIINQPSVTRIKEIDDLLDSIR
ncbi:chlorohydrolase [compost metagenome]